MISFNDGEFSRPAERHSFSGFLFDLDGTIVDSTKAIIEHWKQVALELGVTSEEILLTSHGRRSIDVIRHYDPSRATWEYVSEREGQLPVLYGDLATEIDGARNLLDSVEKGRVPWAIVTSGTRALATGWLARMDLPQPRYLIVAEDVEFGKPNPEGYKMGAFKLFPAVEGGSSGTSRIAVFEDAPAGVQAGKAAGHFVIGLSTTHSPTQLVEAGADCVVKDLNSVRLVTTPKEGDEAGLTEIEIKDIWVCH